MSRPKGFLDLPLEIRDEIYEYLVVKPTNTITMLEEHYNCYQNPISAAQPAISRVNRQIRMESLPMFYKRNLFSAELSNFMDLNTAKSWLDAIGDVHAACVRRLELCGWTKVALGTRKCRLWIRVSFNLKDGTLAIAGNELEAEGNRPIFKDMCPMTEAYRAMIESREGRPFDVESVGKLMNSFHGLCAEYCTENTKDLDGSCEKCEP